MRHGRAVVRGSRWAKYWKGADRLLRPGGCCRCRPPRTPAGHWRRALSSSPGRRGGRRGRCPFSPRSARRSWPGARPRRRGTGARRPARTRTRLSCPGPGRARGSGDDGLGPGWRSSRRKRRRSRRPQGPCPPTPLRTGRARGPPWPQSRGRGGRSTNAAAKA